MLPLETPTWGISPTPPDVVDALGTTGGTVSDSAVSVLGAIGANNANNAFASNLVAANADGSVLERLEFLASQLQGQTDLAIVKADGAVAAAGDPLFTVSGGPIMVLEFVGIVTTVIGAGPVTCQINANPTVPGVAVNLSTAVAISADAVGTSYTFTAAAPGVLTPTTNGALANVPATKWLVPVGTIDAAFSADETGVIAWYMAYRKLDPLAVVAAA